MERGFMEMDYTIGTDVDNLVSFYENETHAYGEGETVIMAMKNYQSDLKKLISRCRSIKPKANLVLVDRQFGILFGSIIGSKKKDE